MQWPSNYNTNFYYKSPYDLRIVGLWAWANYFTLYIEMVKDMKCSY
jgi:hypothetical protein